MTIHRSGADSNVWLLDISIEASSIHSSQITGLEGGDLQRRNSYEKEAGTPGGRENDSSDTVLLDMEQTHATSNRQKHLPPCIKYGQTVNSPSPPLSHLISYPEPMKYGEPTPE